ncbi:MAG: hypothetical protein JWQ81_3526 [Amycolatopsis sp.]|nr:hypothetical protein [Amycolatopsis sp.]
MSGGEAQVRSHGPVDVRATQFRVSPYDLRLAVGLGAAQQSDHVHRVAARVHQGAAGKVEVVADVAELGQGEAEARLDQLKLAQLAGLD